MASNKTIAILTGGGDVPGLNPAIRAITMRALREGYRVLGIRRGWAGLVDYNRDDAADNSESVQELSEAEVNRAGRTGGTFLHTPRTRPSHLPRAPSSSPTRYARRQGHTSAYSSSRSSADTRASLRCCRRWRALPIAASSQSIRPMSSI